MNNTLILALSEILADTYALSLKTQNFHWNVTSPCFKMLHSLFEEQYDELAEAVDILAERIRALGHKSPASFSAFQKLTQIKEGDVDAKAAEMIKALAEDHQYLAEKIKTVHGLADTHGDIGTASLLEDRIRSHEKTVWMLKASV